MKYGFIQEHQNEFSIAILCDTLGVSRSGYYDWLHHTPGKRELDLRIFVLGKNLESYFNYKNRQKNYALAKQCALGKDLYVNYRKGI